MLRAIFVLGGRGSVNLGFRYVLAELTFEAVVHSGQESRK